MATRWRYLRYLGWIVMVGCGGDGEGDGGGAGASRGGGSAAVPEGPAATYVGLRFGRSDASDELFYLEDLEIRVRTDPDDGSQPREWTVSTVGKGPDYVPFVTLLAGERYHLAQYGGRLMRWDGATFIDQEMEPAELPEQFGQGTGAGYPSNEVTGEATLLGPFDDGVTIRRTWDPEVTPRPDRWFCNVTQSGCSCSRDPADASVFSWDTCPVLDYHCCWESADADTCSCQSPGSVTFLCDQRAETEGGRVVDYCPGDRGERTDDARFVGVLTAPEVELPRDRALPEARESGRVQISTVPCSSYAQARLDCQQLDGSVRCTGVCDEQANVDAILLGAYLELLIAECSGDPTLGLLDVHAAGWSTSCAAACSRGATDDAIVDRLAQRIDTFECAAPDAP